MKLIFALLVVLAFVSMSFALPHPEANPEANPQWYGGYRGYRGYGGYRGFGGYGGYRGFGREGGFWGR